MKGDGRIGSFVLGQRPYIVGTISSEVALRDLRPGNVLPCDIVEIRLDQLGVDSDGWQQIGRELEESGVPILLTLRHADEGGSWTGSEEERTSILCSAMEWVSAVDVELGLGEFAVLSATATNTNTALIGSFHDFQQTPKASRLDDYVEQGLQAGVDIVKVATCVQTHHDQELLLALLDKDTIWLSVLAMGEGAGDRRVELVQAGSCLSYGFLDQPIAPGQVSARELWERINGVRR